MDDDKKPKEEDDETTEIFVTPVQIAPESHTANVEDLLKPNDSNSSGHLYAAIDYLATIFGATNPFIKRVDDDIDNEINADNENQKNEDNIDESEVYSPPDPTKLPKDDDIDEDVDEDEEEADNGSLYNVISTPEKQNLHRIDEITNTKHMTQSHKQEPVKEENQEFEKSWTFIKNDDDLRMKEPVIKETIDSGEINAFIEHQIDSEMLLQEPELPVVVDQSSTITELTPPPPPIQTPSAEYSTNSDVNTEDMESDPSGPYE